jgi:hypothetical protein
MLIMNIIKDILFEIFLYVTSVVTRFLFRKFLTTDLKFSLEQTAYGEKLMGWINYDFWIAVRSLLLPEVFDFV